MESNTPNNPAQPFKSTGVTPVRGTSEPTRATSDRFAGAAQAVREVEDRGAEIIDQAKQRAGEVYEKAGEVYEQANKAVTEQYGKAVDYTRENPGKTTLIAFGIGVGVGAILLSSLTGSRSRRSRVVEPVMSAVSTLAREFFR